MEIQRENIISMLSELLEKVRTHDSIVAEKINKEREIREVERKINTPMKKFSFIAKLLGIIFVVVGWLILLICYLVKRSNYKKLQAALQEQKAALEAEHAEICARLNKYDEEELNPYINSIVPDKFPARYCMNAYAIEAMMNLCIDLRADTIKETINLYETIQHRTALENLMSKVASSTAATARSTARTASASEATAASTASIAVSSAATAAATQYMASHPTSVNVDVQNTVENNIHIE